MSRIIVTSTLVTDMFPVLVGGTPHSGAVCTASLWKNGVSDATAVTVAEIGVTGWYKVTFTPATAGFWFLDITNDHNADHYSAEYDVAAAPAAAPSTGDIDTALSLTHGAGAWGGGGAGTPMPYDTDLEVPRTSIYKDVACVGQFPIYEIATGLPKTGLLAGITYKLWRNGAVYAGFVVTLAEVGTSGYYSYSFTPIATGGYVIEFANGENSQIVRVEYEVVAPVLIGVSP